MRKIGTTTMLLLLIVVAGGLFLQQDIRDYLRLRGYTPPSEIAALADDTTMANETRRLFYLNHPEIVEKDIFNAHCRDNEHTIVLGCFLPGQQRIYLLAVDDERLEGVKEVTAAHELLHAAYERLGTKERDRINALLEDAFNQVTDARILETVELYRKQNPAVVLNELHSILGTEVRVLSPDLEEYYSRYFSNRGRIVGYSEQYERAFTERRNAIRSYDSQLENLRAQIDERSAQLKRAEAELNSDRERMNQLRASGQFAAHDAMVPTFNAKVRRYNADVDRLDDLVANYNDIVLRRNAIVAEEAELVEAIDSRTIVPAQQ